MSANTCPPVPSATKYSAFDGAGSSTASIDAVLDPAQSNALYFVADGTGGHVFADTLEQHNVNVQKWYAIRRARGQM